MSEKVYLNGRIVEASEAAVSVSNPSLLHGVGLFETLRVFNGKPFRLAAHVDRMRASAEKLKMSLGSALDSLPQTVEAVLQANGLVDARVRFTLTPPGTTDPADRPTLLVSASAVSSYPREWYEKGMSVWLCTDYRQSAHDPLAGHKTTSYLPRLIALREAQQRHCGEAVWFTPANLLAEGSVSNVFLVRDGKLKTPPLDTPVLPGVTRAAVLELAAVHHIPAEESPCTVNELLDADEVFLTNVIMEVMPVTRVERRAIADEKVGAITAHLARLYRGLVVSS